MSWEVNELEGNLNKSQIFLQEIKLNYRPVQIFYDKYSKRLVYLDYKNVDSTNELEI
jgi:hypothetical protein